MPTLDATLGGASANSYGSVEDADTYFENKFSGPRWRALSEDAKALGLIEATEVFEGLRFHGTRKTETQALWFPAVYEPASNGTSIPGQILRATFLLALDLAERAAAGGGEQAAKIAEMRAAQVSRLKVGDYEVSLDGGGGEGAFESLPAAVQELIGLWVRKGSRIVPGKRCRTGLYPPSLPWACR